MSKYVADGATNVLQELLVSQHGESNVSEELKIADLELDFIETLIRLRKKFGYSQTKVAKLLGTSQQVYSRYENLERTPSLELVLRLLSIYNAELVVTSVDDGEVLYKA